MGEKREMLALQFCDGSFSVFADGTDLQEAFRQCEGDNRYETDPAKLSRVVSLNIEFVRAHLPTCDDKPPCPACGRPLPAQTEARDDG